MLVLSRRMGQRVYVGDDGSFFEVRRVAGNRVTIACSFPDDVKLLRGELLDAIECADKLPVTKAEQIAAQQAEDSAWERFWEETQRQLNQKRGEKS